MSARLEEEIRCDVSRGDSILLLSSSTSGTASICFSVCGLVVGDGSESSWICSSPFDGLVATCGLVSDLTESLRGLSGCPFWTVASWASSKVS